MASITAVELGADTCVLARTSVRRGEVALLAIERLDPAAFPGIQALTTALRTSRRALSLPRRCRVVLWGLPDGASRRDAAVKPRLLPLTEAGFSVERVVTPCNALAALARVRRARGDGGTCWVAINREGVAIVVLRPGRLIYSHSFAWDSTIGATGSQARLLQRYSLVASLSPHVKRAMNDARDNGVAVEAVVTCGNLPDLRSLTMPLIEELDVEVETLDSLEGLIVKPALAEGLADAASAIRLACAGAIARGTRPWLDPKRLAANRTSALVRAAAAIALLLGALGIGYGWYRNWEMPWSRPSAPAVRPAPVIPPATRGNTQGATPGQTPRSTPPAVSVPASGPKSHPPAVSVPASGPASQPQAGRVPAAGPKSHPPAVSVAAPGRPASDPSLPALLPDPIPKFTGVLVSSERRFATVDSGRIVRVGDVIGKRTVAAIDERAVVLREPSGVQIRVGLGGRVLRIERGRL